MKQPSFTQAFHRVSEFHKRLGVKQPGRGNLHPTQEMLEGTRLLSPNLPGWPQLPKSTLETTELLVERGTVMDVAVNWAKKGETWTFFIEQAVEFPKS